MRKTKLAVIILLIILIILLASMTIYIFVDEETRSARRNTRKMPNRRARIHEKKDIYNKC